MAWSAVGVFIFAVLTVMASLTDLPVELLHIIVEQLHDAGYWKALKSLRLTCKVLCDCVNPLLFSTVNINLHHLARASSQLEAFAKERSNVNKFARHLEIMSLEQRYEGHDINALHAAWSNFKASKYICTALQSLENVESVDFHICKYNPHHSSIFVMEALTCMPSITTLRLTEDFGTIWRDIRFDLFTTIRDLTIDAATGYFLELTLPNFMVNNARLERLCIKFCPGYGRSGWSLDLTYLLGEVKEPIALQHLELHGRWKLSNSDCIQLLPHLSSLCLSDDDDHGKSLELLLCSLVHPLERLSLPNGAREGHGHDIIYDHLESYAGLVELTVGPSGLSNSGDRLRKALFSHIPTLKKVSWEQAMFTRSDFDFAAISQLQNLQSLSISLISSMKNIVMGEVIITTANAWLDVATSLPHLTDLNIEVIRRPRSHLNPCEEPMKTIDLVVMHYVPKSDTLNAHLKVHTISNCYRQLVSYGVENGRFVSLYSVKGGLEQEVVTYPPCRPDFGDGDAPYKLWGAAIVSFCLGYWFEAYPSGRSLLAMAGGCFVVTMGMEVIHAITSSHFESALFGRLPRVHHFM